MYGLWLTLNASPTLQWKIALFPSPHCPWGIFLFAWGRGELFAFLPAAQVSLCSSFSSVVSKTQQVFSMNINAWKYTAYTQWLWKEFNSKITTNFSCDGTFASCIFDISFNRLILQDLHLIIPVIHVLTFYNSNLYLMPFQNECFTGLCPGWITHAHKLCTVMLVAMLDPAGAFKPWLPCWAFKWHRHKMIMQQIHGKNFVQMTLLRN